MQTLEITKTHFRVADFVTFQRQGTLELSPSFQRRPVWKPDARSYFVDTVLRGLPAPIIYIRERVDLTTQAVSREVVDGQQRLRTLFSFIDESLLKDFVPDRDRFTIKAIHNKEAAGRPFSKLPKDFKQRVLSYVFSTHILPINVEDREVLQMFARLNSTGVKLNRQELRNAEFFGEFKTIVYRLAFEQLERWRRWKLFTEDQIARMREVEFTGDLLMSMIDGLTGMSQKRQDDIYRKHDASFRGGEEAARRFRRVIDSIDELLGAQIVKTVYSSEVHFFTLFVFLYDRMYRLGSKLKRVSARDVPRKLERCLLEVSNRFRSERVPAAVLDAVKRASADYGRRKTRLDYMSRVCHGATR